MPQKLTQEQIEEYIDQNLKIDIVENTQYNDLAIFFKIKITGKILYGSYPLYNTLIAPFYNWKQYAIETILTKFHEYIKACTPDENYLKLCDRLNVPIEIKEAPEKFNIAYLTKEDFDRCDPNDDTSIYDDVNVPLSYDDIYDLCMSYKKPVTGINKRIQELIDSISYDISYLPDNDSDKILILDAKLKIIEIAVKNIKDDKSISIYEKTVIINMIDSIYKLLKTTKYKIISNKSVNESLNKMFNENSK